MAYILVVEDDPDLQFLYCTALNQKGHEAMSAETARNALIELNSGKHFDAIILDLNLPDAHGMMIIDFIVEDKRHTVEQVVVITANDHWLGHMADRGVKHTLVKPVSMSDVVQTVERIAVKQ